MAISFWPAGFASFEFGVNTLSVNPDALPEVINARSSKRPDGVGSGYNSPAAVIPQRGKVRKDSHPASNSECWRVFHEHDCGSNVANDSRLFPPKSAFLVVKPGAVSGDGHPFAGKSSGNDIDPAAPGFSVEGLYVVPDGEPGQDAITLSLDERPSAVGVDLHSTDTGMSEKDSAQDSSP